MAYAIPVEAYEEHLNCSICMEIFKDPRALPCMHTYCVTCLRAYLVNLASRTNISDGFECPVCRVEIPPPRQDLEMPVEYWAESYPPNYTVKGLVEEAMRQATRHIDAVTSARLSNKASSSDVKCVNHVEKDAEFFCKDHDMNCCSMCAALKHRQCKTLVYLGNLSDASQHSEDDCPDNDEGDTVGGDGENASGVNRRVNEHKVLSRLSKHHRKFAGQDATDRESIDVIEEDFKRAVVIVGCTSETKFIDESGTVMTEDCVGESDVWAENHSNTPSQRKLPEQTGNATIERDIDREYDGASVAGSTRVPTALELEQAVKDLELCASVPEVLLYQSSFDLHGEYAVNLTDESKPCSVTGMSALPDGRVLLVDANNSRIKMFTNNCDYMTHITLPWQPFGIATVSEFEVVVSFPIPMFLQIVFVSDRAFVSGRVIPLMKPCYGVACCNHEIYVVMEDEIRIIDTTGVTLSIFPKGKETFISDPVLKNARYIAVSNCESGRKTIYVTDNNKGCLTCVNKIGKYMSFTDYEIANPTSIAAASSGSVFVCSAPRRLLQIGIVEKGALTETVLELSKIQTVYVSEYDNRVWVTCQNDDRVRVYDTFSRSTHDDADFFVYPEGEDQLI